jgi:YbbR domain-containing protein
MKTFLKKNWYFILMALMLVAIYFLYKKAHQPQPTVTNTTAVIDSLQQTVDSLVEANDNLQIAYDNKQATIINNITYKNAQDAKTIAKLPNLVGYQRDSLWAVLLTRQDSVPGGYWSVLKQKTGGRTPKELAIQGDLQK